MFYKIWGLAKTLYAYVQTPKGRHDFFDYMRAFGVILWTIFAVMAVVAFAEKFFSG